MKIVITVESFDPNKGYFEYYLARELTELGHKVCIFTFNKNKRISVKTLKEGFQVIRIPYFAVVNGHHVPTLRGLTIILNYIKRGTPNIVHCQPVFSPTSIIFMMFSQLYNIKIVGTIITGTYKIDSIKKKVYNALLKITIKIFFNKRVNMFYSISRELKNILIRKFNLNGNKINIIPLGVDHNLFKPDPVMRKTIRNNFAFKEDHIIVVYSGKISKNKGLHIMLDALSPIIKEKKNVKFLIIGKGESNYINYLKNLSTELNIQKNIIFYPWVHRTVLPSFFSACDIAVWPGDVSISIIEAMSMELPIIIKNHILTRYLIKNNNGFIYPYGDVKILNRYLSILINNIELRKEMGKNSRLYVEEKLNFKKITLQYLESYKTSDKVLV